MKRVVSCLLVIVLLFSIALPTSLFAEAKEENTIGVSQNENGNSDVNQNPSIVSQNTSMAEVEVSTIEQPVSVAAATDEGEKTGSLEPEMTTEGSTDAVTFPDVNLFNALVASGVDKNTDGIITQGEIGSVTYLTLYYKDITNLTGLEYAVKLDDLSLWGNKNLTDIEPLRNLKNLRSLSLVETNVSNIEPIRDLVKVMSYLGLDDTPVSDADKVSLVRLNDFSCAEGGLIYKEIMPQGLGEYTINSTDQSIVEAAIEKADGYLADFKIKFTGKKTGVATVNLSIGSGKKSLEITVNDSPKGAIRFNDENLLKALLNERLDYNQDGCITQSELAGTSYVYLANKDITDLTGLEFATGLETLSLNGNAGLTNIEPIKGLTKIKSLNLNETGVSDADKISLVRLSDLTCSAGGSIYQEILPSGLCEDYSISSSDEAVAVATIEKINSYTKIKVTAKKAGKATISLKIGTAKKDFAVTVNAANVEAIEFKDQNLLNALIADGYCDQNKDGVITREELAKVTSLSLDNRNLKDISELEYATGLVYLYLGNNPELSNIDSLKHLNKLKILSLNGTAVSDADRMSFVSLPDVSGIKGYGQTITITPQGLATNYTVTSSDSNVAEASVKNADYSYQSTLIQLYYKNQGTATITVSIGTASKSFQVTVSPLPQGAISFEDQKLGAALIRNGVDRNSDGYVGANEIELVKELRLDNSGIKSLKGLESATGLEYLYLSANPDLTDLTPIKNIAGTLKVLDIADTGVSAADKLSFLCTNDQAINQGAYFKCIKPEGVLTYREFPEVDLTFSNPEVAAIHSTWGVPYITGKKPGKTVVTVAYQGASTSFNLTVNAVNPAQPVGQKVTNLPVLNGSDQTSLDDKGNLYDVSSGETKLVKTGVKAYANMGTSVPAQVNEPDYIRQWATIMDNLNTLWLWDLRARDKAPTEQVKNVTKTVSEYVYTTDSLYSYDNFGLALDNSNGLWMMKNDSNETGYAKVMDNVQNVSWTFALDANQTLWQFYEDKKELLKDVKDFDFIVPSRNTDAPVYALKTDQTLWYGMSGSGGFTMIAEKVDHLVKSDGVHGYVKTDGTSWEYISSGSSEVKAVSEFYKKKLAPFAVKKDGTTWYTSYRDDFKPVKLLDTEIKERRIGYDADGKYGQYLLDINNSIWKFNDRTYEVTKIGNNVKALTGSLEAKNQVGSISGFINTAGEWLDLNGKPQAKENIIYYYNNFQLKGDKVLYYQDVPQLDQVVLMSVADDDGVYATRTDGTVWKISSHAAPTMIKTNNQTNPENPFTSITCSYQTHVQDIGWQEWKINGDISGTSAQAKRLEGIKIKLDNPGYDLGVEYSTHIESIGWQEPKTNGGMSGTEGKGLRLEAIRVKLTGADAAKFDVYYQVHAQNYGWLDWAKNGADSGTAGFGYRLEGIKIVVVPKGDPAPGKTEQPFIEKK